MPFSLSPSFSPPPTHRVRVRTCRPTKPCKTITNSTVYHCGSPYSVGGMFSSEKVKNIRAEIYAHGTVEACFTGTYNSGRRGVESGVSSACSTDECACVCSVLRLHPLQGTMAWRARCAWACGRCVCVCVCD